MSTVQEKPLDKRMRSENYDRNIIPSETARRQEREGDNFKQLPEPTQEEIEAGLDTTGGYTISREGLLNNYAIEPEMYYEVPGDRAAILEDEVQRRCQQLKEVNETNQDGKLTHDADCRGQGVGLF